MLSLLQRLNRLKLGGAFLFADVMEPSTERARRHFATAWKVELFTHTREQQVATSFSGWFTFGDAPGQVPPNWKQSMIVLLTLFPVVMLELLYLSPLLQSLKWR